ncbi:aldose 1-epimerase [Eremomyces bilateralis CBS 781.70]|uniref:Aldose 1-epimerase n=1 Tax=Eremomyces bilateralis CBS 781.70 TaxID=1392243 RepID=A0A6G1G2X0_9PEZI|nr:aldose 1-epimerase [Eremomyces bilateralis CBS 781.70]KAF1812270.1 aldose 1-epimerase [Eremomyces bilateralis CBS 781.70]
MSPRGFSVLGALLAIAQLTAGFDASRRQSPNSHPGEFRPDEDGKYTIGDLGITAQFIPYGASITNLFVKDRHGVERDIVLGYDNASYYPIDESHPHLGGVPGRYANRIKNGTYDIDGVTYHTDLNDNDGLNTLHGGRNGWDYRNFTVVAHSSDRIVFRLIDEDCSMGFPGRVEAEIEYSVSAFTWHIKMWAKNFTEKTPIMLTSHTYWNLDGFQNPDTPQALGHKLWTPRSKSRVATDGILIPNGDILPSQEGSVNDFWSKPKPLGASFGDSEIEGNCGTDCRGYDTCYIVTQENDPRDRRPLPLARLESESSGIVVDIFSEQHALQMYSCNNQDGTMPLKKTQGFFDDPTQPRTVQQYGCVVLEAQDWIDGINHPEWEREKRQIFGPGDEYFLEISHTFSLSPDQ